jgi:hypothetical protein
MTPSARDPVQFTRESAERIANVVRAAELTPTPGRALNFDAILESPRRRVFRMATFTGAWPKGTAKAVSVGGGASINAWNLFAAIGASADARNCAIARDGTAWYLIAAEC